MAYRSYIPAFCYMDMCHGHEDVDPSTLRNRLLYPISYIPILTTARDDYGAPLAISLLFLLPFPSLSQNSSPTSKVLDTR